MGTNILVIYNQPVLPKGHRDWESEQEILHTAESVQKALAAHGHEVRKLGIGRDPNTLVTALRNRRPDAVVNLFEGLADAGHTEAVIAGLLEWYHVPFTGSPSQTLCLARNKPLTKMLLVGAGLPTPDFFAIHSFDDPHWQGGQIDRTSAISRRVVDWPVIVKASNQDASIGIDQGSVVTSDSELIDRVNLILERYGPPVLVEQYIDGREMTVCVVELPELRPLPVSEFVFKPRKDNAWRIVTYDAKWHVESRDFELTPYSEVASVGNGMREKLHDLSLRAYRLLGLRDYGRIDFRVTKAGKPYILEANPNPDLAPMAGMSLAMECGGTPYSQLIPLLVEQALNRGAGVDGRLEPVN